MRLDTRMAKVLSALGNAPNLSIPAACGGHSETQAAYRFFDNENVTFDKVIAPHIERTLQRVAEQKVVLLVQDTTEIDLTRPEQEVVGVGELDGARRGVLLHDLQAFTTEGTPLGTLGAEVLNRPEVSHAPEPQKQQRRRKQTPIEEKESLRWLTGLRRTREVAARLPQVQLICVADSEADIYELFAEPRADSEGAPAVDWLFRACQDRALETEADSAAQHLRDAVLATPILYKVNLLIRGARGQDGSGRSRTASGAQGPQSEGGGSRRDADPAAAVACGSQAVAGHGKRGAGPRIQAAQGRVGVGVDPGDDAADRQAGAGAYGGGLLLREMEYRDLFRTLKSGCRIERRRFEHVDRILPCMAMYLIVAWRTQFVCRMGRECPDADCEILFEPSEWKAVWVAVNHKKPPKKKPRLAEMVHLIAQLGGYVERPKSEPGAQTVWIGLQRMYDLAWAWQAFGPEAEIRDA